VTEERKNRTCGPRIGLRRTERGPVTWQGPRTPLLRSAPRSGFFNRRHVAAVFVVRRGVGARDRIGGRTSRAGGVGPINRFQRNSPGASSVGDSHVSAYRAKLAEVRTLANGVEIGIRVEPNKVLETSGGRQAQQLDGADGKLLGV
jgi:hypothetical protein